MAIVRPVPKIYDFVGALRSQLSSAYNIVESKEFGQINTLTFKYSYYLIDANGNTIYDADGQPQEDPRIGTIINEFLVEFNGDWYIIKNVEEGRASDGAKFIHVSCVGKATELSFKQVRYVNLSPPIHAPIDAKQAILEVITYPYQMDLGYGKITAVSSNVVTLGVATTFDFTGYKLVTLEGTGKYQQRKITSYNTTTKQATLESAFSPQVNTTTVFRVHNSKYTLGYVDPLLINDGVANIFRSLKFEDVTINDALQTISTKYNGFLKFTTAFAGVYNEYNTSVDLRLPNSYNNYEFRYRKNTKGVKRIIDSSNGCYTRVYPEGRNNLSITSVATKTRTDHSVTYNEHELGKGDIYNFQYFLSLGYTIAQCRDLFVRDFRFIEDAYTDAAMLYDGAKKALEEFSLPSITYEVEGVDLSVVGITSGTFGVGDTIQVVDTDLGFDFRATVVSKEIDWDMPYAPRITLSNFTDKLGDLFLKMLKYQEAFSNRKSLYGKAVSVVIADEATSRNWRYADYVIPADGSITADYIINAAITEVSGLGGGEVVLSDGEYGLSSGLIMESNVILVGASASTRVYPKSNASMCIRATTVKNIEIKSLFIDYARQSDGTSLLYRFTDGIGIYSGCDTVKVDNIIMEYVDNNMVIAIASSNIFVFNNIFKSDNLVFSGTDCVDLKSCFNGNIYNNSFLNNINPYRTVIGISDETTYSQGEFFIENNYMYLTKAVPDTGGSILVTGLIDVITTAYVRIKNNTIITSNYRMYSMILTTMSTTTNIDIQNNTIDGYFHTSAIAVKGGNKINIQNNIIRGYGSSVSSMAIYITKDLNNIVAQDCVIQNNNVKRGNTYGVVSTALTYGVYISTGTLRTIVSGNDLYLSGTTSSFTDLGTGTQTLGGNKL